MDNAGYDTYDQAHWPHLLENVAGIVYFDIKAAWQKPHHQHFTTAECYFLLEFQRLKFHIAKIFKFSYSTCL